MRELDGQARIFIGSSSEGRAAASTVASALETAGMRPLLWSDFFKTRDLPLRELDRRMADADGAILVGSADDRLVSREHEFDQMRDNVLFEYGLFAGHLGRHRCVLLMPDDPRFRVPSDFLGVAGFEFYTEETLNAVAKKVPERLQTAFAVDGFKPPSLQERCRRMLLLGGWIRGEIAAITLKLPNSTLKKQLGEKVEAVLCFLKEDIDELGLREDATALEELVKKSLDDFPKMPSRSKARRDLEKDVERFLLSPNKYELASQHDAEWRYYGHLLDVLGEKPLRIFDYGRNCQPCRWCGTKKGEACRYPKFEPNRYEIWNLLYGYEGCVGRAWYAGALDLFIYLGDRHMDSFDDAIRRLERWQENWVPRILDRLGAVEQTVHKQIFGHL